MHEYVASATVSQESILTQGVRKRSPTSSDDPPAPYQRVLDRLTIHKESDGHAVAYCPSCPPGKRAGLSVTESPFDGRVLIYCHRGCNLAEIADALDIQVSDLFADGGKGSPEAREARESIAAWLEAIRRRRWTGIGGDSALRLYHALAAAAWHAGRLDFHADYRTLAELGGVALSTISRTAKREIQGQRVVEAVDVVGTEPPESTLVVLVTTGGHVVSGTRMASAWSIYVSSGTFTRAPATVSDTVPECSATDVIPTRHFEPVAAPAFGAWRAGRVVVGGADQGRAFAGTGWRIWLALQSARQPLTAQAAAAALGLSSATVRTWMVRFERHHLAVKLDPAPATGRGRRAARWMLVSDADSKLRYVADRLGWTIQAERQRERHADERMDDAARRPRPSRDRKRGGATTGAATPPDATDAPEPPASITPGQS